MKTSKLEKYKTATFTLRKLYLNKPDFKKKKAWRSHPEKSLILKSS